MGFGFCVNEASFPTHYVSVMSPDLISGMTQNGNEASCLLYRVWCLTTVRFRRQGNASRRS